MALKLDRFYEDGFALVKGKIPVSLVQQSYLELIRNTDRSPNQTWFEYIGSDSRFSADWPLTRNVLNEAMKLVPEMTLLHCNLSIRKRGDAGEKQPHIDGRRLFQIRKSLPRHLITVAVPLTGMHHEKFGNISVALGAHRSLEATLHRNNNEQLQPDTTPRGIDLTDRLFGSVLDSGEGSFSCDHTVISDPGDVYILHGLMPRRTVENEKFRAIWYFRFGSDTLPDFAAQIERTNVPMLTAG